MEESEKLTQEEFIEQMGRFQNQSAQQIIDIIDKEEYVLPVAVLGLISITRALINTFGNEELMNEAAHYLTLKEDELYELSEEDEETIKEKY